MARFLRACGPNQWSAGTDWIVFVFRRETGASPGAMAPVKREGGGAIEWGIDLEFHIGFINTISETDMEAGMSGNVIEFPNAKSIRSPIAHFIRLGDTGYRQTEELLSSGRFPVRHVVVDASVLRYQQDLVAALKAGGVELILDTKVAELASPSKAGGRSRGAPWADQSGQLLGPNKFSGPERGVIAKQIAKFAVEQGFDAVLAPTHFLDDSIYQGWLDLDSNAVEDLRNALDNEGGNNIRIDFPLLMKNTSLNDSAYSKVIPERLVNLPITNVWIRAAGFGADASPLGTRRYITSLRGMHNWGFPIVGDYLGGIVGLSALAFGAIGGISHGIGEYQRFDASGWSKIPTDKKGGGRAHRVSYPEIGRTLTFKEIETLLKSDGARKFLSCNDRSCCAHGFLSTKTELRHHNLHQSVKQVGAIQMVPGLNRIEDFLSVKMTRLLRNSRQFSNIRISEAAARESGVDAEQLKSKMENQHTKIEKIFNALENLSESVDNESHKIGSVVVKGAELGSGFSSKEIDL